MTTLPAPRAQFWSRPVDHPKAYAQAGMIGGLSALMGLISSVDWSAVAVALLSGLPVVVSHARAWARESERKRIAALSAACERLGGELAEERAKVQRLEARRFDRTEAEGE